MRKLAQVAVACFMTGCGGNTMAPIPTPSPVRTTIAVSGTWNGSVYLFSGTFTVTTPGPVDATATVMGFVDSMRLALLGYNAASTTGSACSTTWLPAPLPFGPTMTPPIITAHWDSIPAGAYCLNAVGVTAVPPYPAPYSWTVMITHP